MNTREYMQAHLKKNHQDWDHLWQIRATPWDLQGVTPTVIELFNETVKYGLVIPDNGTVLIPGCGLAYDGIFIAKKGYRVTAIDISAVAVDGCIKNRNTAGVSEERMNVICQDFFKYSVTSLFDAIFDYTFLCALPPPLRSQWAISMADLCKLGSGYLITLMFPLVEEPNLERGPPYQLSLPVYHELLDPNFELIYLNKCTSEPSREGLELLGIWRRKNEAIISNNN